jgi:hypothetical protein
LASSKRPVRSEFRIVRGRLVGRMARNTHVLQSSRPRRDEAAHPRCRLTLGASGAGRAGQRKSDVPLDRGTKILISLEPVSPQRPRRGHSRPGRASSKPIPCPLYAESGGLNEIKQCGEWRRVMTSSRQRYLALIQLASIRLGLRVSEFTHRVTPPSARRPPPIRRRW